MTADEAAAYLRYPTTAAFRMDLAKKPIPRIRRGRRVFFVQSELDAFMRGDTAAEPQERAS